MKDNPKYTSTHTPSFDPEVEFLIRSANKFVKAPIHTEKRASVVKRGIVGSIIGGVPGAIIGAASAIDKNNKHRY